MTGQRQENGEINEQWIFDTKGEERRQRCFLQADGWTFAVHVQDGICISQKRWGCCRCDPGYHSFLLWKFEKSETELWKEPPEPLLEKIASTLLSESKVWEGTASELCEILGEDVKPNVLSLRLSINANRLLKDYGIHYKASRTHNGRKLSLMK